MAEETKEQGNVAFKSRDFEAAVSYYSAGIDLSPDNHVLYSNRSAAYAAINQNLLALKDAVKTYELRPDWPRSYVRLGYAHLGLGRLDQALCAFKLGLEICPGDAYLKSGYERAIFQAKKRAEPSKPHPLEDIFTDPVGWGKLLRDPATENFVSQKDFLRMTRDIKNDPFNASSYSSDPRLLQALAVLLKVKLRGTKQPDLVSLPPEQSAPAVQAESKRRQHVHEEESEDEIELKKNVQAAIKNYITQIELDDNISKPEKEKPRSSAANSRMLKFEDGINGRHEESERLSAYKPEFAMTELDQQRNSAEILCKLKGSSIESLNDMQLDSEDTVQDTIGNVQEDEEIANVMIQLLNSTVKSDRDE